MGRLCWLYLSSYTANLSNNLPSMPNYKDIVLTKATRSDMTCCCYICKTATKQGKPRRIKKGRGYLKTNIDINLNNGLFGASKSPPVQNFNNSSKLFNIPSIKICDLCKACIGPGYMNAK